MKNIRLYKSLHLGNSLKKPFTLLLVSMLMIALVTGCASKDTTPENGNGNGVVPEPGSDEETITIKDYFVTELNTKYFYEGVGNEYATYTVAYEFASDDKVQQRIDNGGTVTARVLECKDGAITRVFSMAESYDQTNYIEAPPNDSEILLKEPLETGNSWTLSDERVRTILGTDEVLVTPSGTYQTIVVETKGPDDVILEYYAKTIGLVKTVFRANDMEVTSTLSRIEK